jgi:hypothetical protein
MTPLWIATAILYAVVVALAWTTAAQRRDHRPVAWLLTLGLGMDVARELIQVHVLQPTRAAMGAGPFHGFARAAFNVDEALFLAWPVGIAACATWVFLRHRTWAFVAAYSLAVVMVVQAYPTLRGAALARVYLAAELAGIVVGIGSFITWAWKRERPNLTHGVTLLIVVVELATLLPFGKGPFVYWSLAQASYVTLYVVLIVVHGGALWDRGSSSQSRSR